MKDCMFQYATRHKVLADTGLITRKEADELFDKNIENFKERLVNGESPEMAVWVKCKDDTSYGNTSRYWDSNTLEVINGKLYQLVEV